MHVFSRTICPVLSPHIHPHTPTYTRTYSYTYAYTHAGESGDDGRATGSEGDQRRELE